MVLNVPIDDLTVFMVLCDLFPTPLTFAHPVVPVQKPFQSVLVAIHGMEPKL